MQSDKKIEGWHIVQVEIRFKDGEAVSEKAVYEHTERPRMLRIRSINVAGDEILSVNWDVTNKMP